MQLYEMQVNKTAITRAAAVRIPKGVIGAVVRFSFSPEWEGLSKTVVFRAGDVSKDILDVKEFAVIPAECTKEVGQLLEVGVYGVDGENTVAIPTMWEAIGRITEAADPSGDTSTDPALPVWAQLQERIRMLEETGVSQKDIEDAIKAYFDGNPPTGQKTAQGGEIYNYYTEKVYTGDNPPKEYPGNTAAKGAFAQNFGTHADGEYSSASGWNSTASGGIAHAEGKLTNAAGYASHAEGGETKATGSYTHSEGFKTEANAPYSHVEGEGSKTEYDGTNGKYAHAEGYYTKTYNTAAHAQGVQTEARGYASHAGGRGTIATCRYQMATGMFNIPDEVMYSDGRGEYAEIVGGGSNANKRDNIYTLDWNGNGWFKGHVYVGNGGTDRNRLAMKNEVPTVYPWAKAVNKPSYTAAEVGAAPTSRTINGKALSSNISLTAIDVGARPSDWNPSATDIGLGDYIVGVETGSANPMLFTSGDKTYSYNFTYVARKWNSGLIEIYGTSVDFECGITKAWGNLFESGAFTLPNYNVALKSVLYCQVSFAATPSSATVAWTEGALSNSLTSPGSTYLCRADPVQSAKGKMCVHTVGTWK